MEFYMCSIDLKYKEAKVLTEYLFSFKVNTKRF